MTGKECRELTPIYYIVYIYARTQRLAPPIPCPTYLLVTCMVCFGARDITHWLNKREAIEDETRRDKTRQVGAQDRRNSHRWHKTRQAKTAQAIRQNQDRTRQRQQRQLSQVTRLDETNQDTTRQTQNEPRQDKDLLPSLFLFY